MRKYLPYLLFVVGVALLIGAGWYGWHTSQGTAPRATAAAPVSLSDNSPSTLAGLTRTEETTGADAIAQIQNLHLTDLTLKNAVVAVYGAQKDAVMWIASTDSSSVAASLIANMETAIANGGTSFTPASVLTFSGRDVYEVEGLGQLHFYFQSGEKIVWLSANQGVAEQALIELMTLYP